MRTQNDISLDLDGVESNAGLSTPQPLVWSKEHAAEAEKFNLLAHRLRRARAKKTIQTVLVTSAVPSEGKSTVALNLAGMFALNGSRTLLIDADLRMPDIQKTLGSPSGSGLGAVLAGELNFDLALRRVDPFGLYLLPAGARVQNPMSLLESPAFKGLLDHACDVFDWVIIDSPPLNPLADSHCIAGLVAAILMVVRWGFTPKEELDRALTALRGLPLMGMVLNKFDDPHDRYYYSYYKQSAALSAHRSAPALPAPTQNGDDSNV